MSVDKSKLEQVLQFINRFIAENGYPPTVREVCQAVDIKSTATAFQYMNRLKERGFLSKADRKKRAVAVNAGEAVKVPVIGTVTAGQPILAVENYDGFCTLPASEFHGEDLFMLQVKGDSMIGAGIFEGDKIVVKKQDTAENGDIVVALFDDGIEEGATVKRFFRRDNQIILHPENPALSDFVLDDVTILGKVVGLLRKF